jgi:hypothetical protein
MAVTGLGDVYDLSTGLSPVDLSLGANTGKRLSMSEVESVSIVVIKAAGTAGQNPVLTLKQHTAASGGVTSDLPIITTYWVKGEATLDGDEVWTEVSQAAGAVITDPGTGSAAVEQLVVISVKASQLTSGNTHISLDVADTGAAAQLGCVLYIVHQADKGLPVALPAPLR